AGAVLVLLPAEPPREGVALAEVPLPVEEALVEVEPVAVDVRSRPADPPVLEPVERLREDAEVGAEVEISVKDVPLEGVGIVTLGISRPEAERVIVVRLEPLPHVRAEGEVVAVPAPERDVLERVPEVGPFGQVLEGTPVLLVPQEFVRRRPGRG